MDLHTVHRWVEPRSRAELVTTEPGTSVVAGGTWLFSAPQPHLTTVVDLHTLAWTPIVMHSDELEIAATCTITELRTLPMLANWPGASLVEPCVSAFASSAKIWDVATVGGNVCLALPAGAMISLLSAWDATALVWSPDDTDRQVPVEDLVAAAGENTLAAGEVLRSLHVPCYALQARAAFRRAALTASGPSGAIVIARQEEDGTSVVCVTAATQRPQRVAFRSLPSREALDDAVRRLPGWHDDQHGSAAWRKAMVRRLAIEVLDELRNGSR